MYTRIIVKYGMHSDYIKHHRKTIVVSIMSHIIRLEHDYTSTVDIDMAVTFTV